MAGWNTTHHLPGFARFLRHFYRFLPGILVTGALLWTLGSTLRVYPHQLAYFNELAGGPENGSRHLLGSNLEWGQDFLFLKEWLRRHPPAATPVVLCDANLDLSDLGIESDVLVCDDAHHARGPAGVYVVGVNFLSGGWGHEPIISAVERGSELPPLSATLSSYELASAPGQPELDVITD